MQRLYLPSKALAEVVRRGAGTVGRRTAGWRSYPDFLLIGAQRCGTTSLFRALNQHPETIRPNFHKGINYFDLNYQKGAAWYRGHFAVRGLRGASQGHKKLQFEASGYYMFHPLAVARIATDLPDVRLVVMLRDPVERAYSAWKHELARGFETKGFATALALETSRLEGEADRMIAESSYQSFSYRHHAYRSRGEYVDQLENVLSFFARDQLHVMYSEEFFAHPEREFTRLTEFLEVAPPRKVIYERHNARPGSSMPPQGEQLRRHYADQVSGLTRLVGAEPPWA